MSLGEGMTRCADGSSLRLSGAAAAGAAGARVPAAVALAVPGDTRVGELLVSQVRDAMLGLAPVPSKASADAVRAGLDGALADFRGSQYGRLSVSLPRLIAAGHVLAAGDSREPDALLAGIYTLTTRMLIKLDDQQLGWMAADRARVFVSGGGDPLAVGEAARNMAVLARKAGWHEQASCIAHVHRGEPAAAGPGPRLTAERGLLIHSAAYTAARAGDRDTMRELTNQAAMIAAGLGDRVVLLRDHGGGFTPATVELHRVSAENYAGDPGAAVAAALRIVPASLPTTERRARYWTDIARAYSNWGRRDDCVSALLAAEREAPEETHARPAVRDLVSGLLVTGRTGPELRGLAARCGIT